MTVRLQTVIIAVNSTPSITLLPSLLATVQPTPFLSLTTVHPNHMEKQGLQSIACYMMLTIEAYEPNTVELMSLSEGSQVIMQVQTTKESLNKNENPTSPQADGEFIPQLITQGPMENDNPKNIKALENTTHKEKFSPRRSPRLLARNITTASPNVNTGNR